MFFKDVLYYGLRAPGIGAGCDLMFFKDVLYFRTFKHKSVFRCDLMFFKDVLYFARRLSKRQTQL